LRLPAAAGGGVRLAKREEAEHISSAKRSVSRSLQTRANRIEKDPGMSELESPRNETAPADSGGFTSQLWRQAPYLIALVLAIFGVAYSNISHQPLIGYWEFLAFVIGLMCVATQWQSVPERGARFRLIGTQALHWAAVLVAMNIIVLFRVQSLLTAPAIGLVLLILLALGTFLAGVALLSLQFCFLGLAMALAVPAIAWLTQSFLFLLLVALLLVGLAIALWPYWSRGAGK
jgi:hypothetical protein